MKTTSCLLTKKSEYEMFLSSLNELRMLSL